MGVYGNIPKRMIEKAKHSSRTEYFYVGQREVDAIYRYLGAITEFYWQYLTQYEMEMYQDRMCALKPFKIATTTLNIFSQSAMRFLRKQKDI